MAQNYWDSDTFTTQFFDGLGRVFAVASNHPGSTGGAKGQYIRYDVMGRAVQQTNPFEMDSGWNPTGDDPGYQFNVANTFDWKGRPLHVYHMDGSYQTFEYAGCGCAGGEVVTITDEMSRQQKVYADVLGRQWKTEILQTINGVTSEYSTTTNAFNARDQITNIKRYAGAAPGDASSTNEAAACPDGSCQKTVMTYDGYGRLATKHVPEQNLGTNTAFAYNTDDTVQSVTDARGASATYGYNNRHLITSIVFAAPGGIPVPSAVGIDYDSAGNRRWMTDGSGRVDYVFDQLSRLQSETRQFNGLSGSYTLSYTYNLTGELQTITEPAGSHADYAYDSIGRLASVSGAGLGTSQYVSSVQYRASGALKSLNYGNSTTLALSYDSRTQPTHYAVGGVRSSANGPIQPEGGDFQYYDDGQIKFASDLRTDSTAYGLHDRAYSYDQAARLKDAYSGYEARDFLNGTNSGIHDGAFRQSYGYDQWNNLTSRTGRFWSEDDSATDSYNNQNRNPVWDYDSDGRLLSTNELPPNRLPYEPLRHAYDAAGRRHQSTQTTSRQILAPVLTTAVTKIESYDGDGMLVKSARTTQLNNNAPATATTFFLRSSLTGNVITEYDAAGNRQNAYVFAGGEIVAQQRRFPDDSTQLMWQHLNPITGDGLNTDSQGTALERTNVDPMGVNVGDTDPFVSNEPTNGGEGEGMGQAAINAMVASLIPGWGGPTCKVDGMATGCRLAFGLLASGGGVLAPSNAQSGVFTRFTNKTNGQVTTRWSPLTAIDTGRGTWFGYLPMGAQLGVDGHPDIFEINLAEIAAPGSRNMTYVGMLRELSSYAMHDVWLQRVSIFKAINEIEDALKNKTCASFMNGVLAELGKTYGRGRGLSFEDLFHSIPVSAFHADPKSGSIASASPDGIMIGHPEFKITIRNLFSGAAAAVLMHEITHGSPTEGNNYTHYQMADAAYTVAGSMGLLDNKLENFGLKGVTPNPNESFAKTRKEAETINNSNSGLFTGLIMKACKIVF